MNIQMRACLLLSCAVALTAAGCGGGPGDQLKTVPAKGKLFLDDQPHGNVMLSLDPVREGEKDTRPRIGGEVDAQGNFALTTYNTGDGAPPGKYNVSLAGGGGGSTDPAAMMGAMGGGTRTEPFQIEIPAGGKTDLEIRLKSTAGQEKSNRSNLLGAPPQ